METKQWIVDIDVDKKNSYQQLNEAAHYLQHNEVIAFPTETVYGLGANATSDAAVSKIFAAKGRPSDNPLIVHIAEQDQLLEAVEMIPDKAQKLIEAFWPGPLTIIFKKKDGVFSPLVTAGLDTVAIRMPNHPLAIALIRASGLPIAAPSANRSGKPSPTTAHHVWEDLQGRIAGIVDGGETGVGLESTVLDCTSGELPVILRPGGITKEAIENVIGKVQLDPAMLNEKQSPKSPGMKYTHYAPNAPMYLMAGNWETYNEMIKQKRQAGLKVGILATAETSKYYDADLVLSCGERNHLHTVAHCLYDTLRDFNKSNVDVIFAETFPKEGVGAAIMNRLEKAAGSRWLEADQCIDKNKSNL